LRRIKKSCAVAVLLTVVPIAGQADDWPQWRGPGRDGVSAESGLQFGWGDEGPAVLWDREAGGGYSGMSVAGGHLFTMWSDDESEFVVVLDAGTGREVWRIRIDELFTRGDGRDGPRSTPTVDGDRLYVQTASGRLVALAVDDGRTLWSHHLIEDFGAEVPHYGFSSSPLVEGSMLIAAVGGSEDRSIMAFDKMSGEVLWGAHDDKTGYASPIAVDGPGGRQIVLLNGNTVSSVSLDGELLWTHPWPHDYQLNIATPLAVSNHRIFVSTSYDIGSMMLEIHEMDANLGVSEVWRNKVLKNHFQSSVILGDHIYGFDNAILKCVVAETGEECWARRGFGKGQLLLVDGHLIVLGERGKLAVVEASEEGYNEIASAQVLRERCWTPPTLSDGRLFVRTETQIMSFDLGAEG